MAGAMQDPGAEVPGGEPGVAEAGHPVDDRPPVGMAGPEAAPLVRDAQPAAAAGSVAYRPVQDALDHLRAGPPGSRRPMSNVPPTSSRPSSSWVATGATMPGSRTGVGSVTSRWPLTRSEGMLSGQPVEHRRQAGGEDHGAGLRPVPADVSHRHHPAAADGDAGGGDPGGHAGQPRGQPGHRAQRVDPGLVPDQRAGHGQRQARDELGHLAGVQPLHGRGLVRGEPAGVRGQPDPVRRRPARPRRARSAPAQRHCSRLARARSTNGSGSLHSWISGVSSPAGPAGGAGAQAAGLDQQHRAEPGLVAGGRGGHAQDAAADDQHIGARLRNGARRRGRVRRAPPR